MTEELQEYLKRSKESRAKLTKLAKQVESVNNSFSLSPNPNDSDYFKPKRFKDFEENMSKDLQKIFRRESLFKHPIVKSVHHAREPIKSPRFIITFETGQKYLQFYLLSNKTEK
jgi:hypothetical protein